MDQAMDRDVYAGEAARVDVRVRVPRGKLLDCEYAPRSTRRGEASLIRYAVQQGQSGQQLHDVRDRGGRGGSDRSQRDDEWSQPATPLARPRPAGMFTRQLNLPADGSASWV